MKKMRNKYLSSGVFGEADSRQVFYLLNVYPVTTSNARVAARPSFQLCGDYITLGQIQQATQNTFIWVLTSHTFSYREPDKVVTL
jgi:hypothetical protein